MPVRAKKVLDDVMVRRLKEDLRAVAGGFPKRIVRQIDIDGLPPDDPRAAAVGAARPVPGAPRRAAQGRDETQAGRRRPAHLRVSSNDCSRPSRRSPARSASTAGPWSGTGKPPSEGQPEPEDHAGQPLLFAEGIDNDDDRATLSEEELQAEEEAQIEAATLRHDARRDRTPSPARSSSSTR